MSGRPKYAAFISYSSKDAAFARRLHRALESYRIPRALGEFHLSEKAAHNRLYPIFRDREELPSGELSKVIDEALAASGALIIVCSPHAAASPWVNKEIETFLKLGRRDRIFAIMAREAPITTDEGADATGLSFPPAFKHDAGFTPLVGDARHGKDGFRQAWLKVAAGIAATNLGSLQDRDAKRRVRQALTFSCVGVTLAVVLAGLLAGFSIQNISAWSSRSQQAAQLAEDALDESRSEDALLLALAGLPAGRGHSLVPPNAYGLVVLERALNEIVVTRAMEARRTVSMMDGAYEPRPLGAQHSNYATEGEGVTEHLLTRFDRINVSERTVPGAAPDGRITEFTRQGEATPFVEVPSVVVSFFDEAPAPSTLLAVFGNFGIAFIDTAAKQPACYLYGDRKIYHAAFLGTSRALVALSPYQAHFAIVNVETCAAEGPPFALVVPEEASESDGTGEERVDPDAFEVIPLGLLDTPEDNVPEDPSLLAAPEELAKRDPGLDAIVGMNEDLVVLRVGSALDRILLFDVKARNVLAAATLPQINSGMGDNFDDYVVDRASGLVIDLNARRGLAVDRGFSAFSIDTVTDLTGAAFGCDGWCLEASGWTFDLKRAVEIARGSIGSSAAWRQAQADSLAWRMQPVEEESDGPEPDIGSHPVPGRVRTALSSWFDDVGLGLITYDLDGSLPTYSVASSADGSLVAISDGEQVWLRSADGDITRRMQTSFPPLDEDESAEAVLLAMAPDGSWFAALGPHDDTMQKLVVWDVASGRRLFDRLVSASATLAVVAGQKGLWLDGARQINLTTKPDFPSLFEAACARRPEGRTTLTPQMLKDLGLGPGDADPCRNRFVLEHLWSEVFR